MSNARKLQTALQNATHGKLRDFSIGVKCHLREAIFKSKHGINQPAQLERLTRLTRLNDAVISELLSRSHELSLTE